MSQFSFVERVWKKVSDTLEPLGASFRRKKLNNTDFSIISNNCWGGRCYEYFGLQKQSPTVGCYFFAEDYIKLVLDLRNYMSMEIKMIQAEESRYAEELRRRGQMHIPVGILGDIEIVFLHYKDPEVAKQKWERRTKRINWDNLILKFSYMNLCEDAYIHQFEKIQGIKKVLFTGKPFSEYKEAYVVPGKEDGHVENDTFYWNRYVDIYSLLNAQPTGIDSFYVQQG